MNERLGDSHSKKKTRKIEPDVKPIIRPHNIPLSPFKLNPSTEPFSPFKLNPAEPAWEPPRRYRPAQSPKIKPKSK